MMSHKLRLKMSFSGFLFDGGNCVDIDECMRDRIDCGEYAQEGLFLSKSALPWPE